MLPDDLLPPDYQSIAFIAGGYAACPALATDIDVWVPVQSPYTNDPEPGDLRVAVMLHKVRDEIIKHLRTRYRVDELNETRGVAADMRYIHQNCTILKVARVYCSGDAYGGGKPIEIMVTDAPSVDVLLASFDISTHQVAMTQQGLRRAYTWTPLSQPPIAIKPNVNTPARMRKICTRYGHPIPAEYAEKLSEKETH